MFWLFSFTFSALRICMFNIFKSIILMRNFHMVKVNIIPFQSYKFLLGATIVYCVPTHALLPPFLRNYFDVNTQSFRKSVYVFYKQRFFSNRGWAVAYRMPISFSLPSLECCLFLPVDSIISIDWFEPMLLLRIFLKFHQSQPSVAYKTQHVIRHSIHPFLFFHQSVWFSLIPEKPSFRPSRMTLNLFSTSFRPSRMTLNLF